MKELLEFIGNPNIAADLDEDVLKEIGSRVKTTFDEDYETMNDWVENVEKGIELMRQEWKPKSTPWQNASNYKDPILTEASVKFGDKHMLEVLRAPNLVGFEVIGKDEQGEKKATAENVVEAMNYQINHDMNGWRDDQQKLGYSLPNVGTAFKKLVYEELEDQCEAVVINYPDFVVNQATKSMERCQSFSHILDFSRNEYIERVNAGRWIDIDLYAEQIEQSDTTDGSKGSNEREGVLSAMDNEDKFVEQQCYYDLDNDGYEEPYIVTIHYRTAMPVRIQARYTEDSIIVEHEDRLKPLSACREAFAADVEAGYGGDDVKELIGMPVPEFDGTQYKLVKIEPFQNIVKYGFIPSPDGTFLDFGYYHLLGALTQSINTHTNQLTDGATLANAGGGLLAKEFRGQKGAIRLSPGEYKGTNVPAEKLAKAVFPNPAREPSQSLYALNKDTLERAMGLLAVVDVSGKIQAHTSPTTALAIIQEAIIPTTALFMRILNCMSKEFQILFKINQNTFSQEKYKKILDVDGVNPRKDFSSEMMDIIPTGNAEMTSKMQRIQTSQIELEMFDRVLQAGGNPIPIIKGAFEAIGSQNIDKVFPEEGSMNPQEAKQLEAMQQAQAKANEIAEFNAQLLSREQDRLDKETEWKIQEGLKKLEEMDAKIRETMARAAKYAEEAETESLNNKTSQYSSGLADQRAHESHELDMMLRAEKIETEKAKRKKMLTPEPEAPMVGEYLQYDPNTESVQ